MNSDPRTEESAWLAEKVAHLDRVRGMGMIASSLAHEMAQPLTSIRLIAEHADLDLGQAFENRKALGIHIGNILTQVSYATQILRRIRDFVAVKEFVLTPVSVQRVHQQAMALLNDWMRSEDVELEIHEPGVSVMVMGDDIQLTQVLVNVYRNCIQACQGMAPARIAVDIQQRQDLALVRIEDNGPGFSAKFMAQGSREFLSTKKDGLGLGLMICRQIVEKHGGRMGLRNGEAGGAIVELEIPAIQALVPASL